MAMRRSMVVALDWALVELRRLLQSARRGPDALAPAWKYGHGAATAWPSGRPEGENA